MGSVGVGPTPHSPDTRPTVYKGKMSRVFEKLAVWIDPVPRDGPGQMACDEALVQMAEVAVLRIFRWSGPWISLGYFTPWHEASAVRPDLPVCRRWTGGGVVVHENDFTFALAAPRSEDWARLRPEESYRVVHAALAGALREVGLAATMFADEARGGAACFAGPVRYDVVNGTRKIAGGAQRRTKRGLLHQGSIQAAEATSNFAQRLADALAWNRTSWRVPSPFEEAVAALEQEKYGSEDFLRKG
jgi:lipoate-protein ligase A